MKRKGFSGSTTTPSVSSCGSPYLQVAIAASSP
nr:MAG TPA: hypothetical protein [Caudoviricetes sp.]